MPQDTNTPSQSDDDATLEDINIVSEERQRAFAPAFTKDKKEHNEGYKPPTSATPDSNRQLKL